MQLVLLVGIEGTGHHGVGPTLNKAAKQAGLTNMERLSQSTKLKKAVKQTIRGKGYQGLVDLFRYYSTICQKKKRPCVNVLSVAYTDRGGEREVMQGSQNWLQNTSELRYGAGDLGLRIRPDLLELYVSRICAVQTILLHRNLQDSLLAHEHFDGGISNHVKVQFQHAHFLSFSLKNIPPTRWIRLNFEDFIQDAADVYMTSQYLYSWLGWDTNFLPHMKNETKKRMWRIKQKPCQTLKWIQKIATAADRNFPVLLDKQHDLFGRQSTFQVPIRKGC